jgi:peptidase YpeB-like protein
MRKKAVITSGVAAAVLGGGLVLALNGGGTASAERTAVERPAAAASPSVRSIGRAEAEQVALAAVPGGRVRSAERETEHGVPVWSVRVVKDGVTHDLDIDARTGKVLRDRADRHAPAGRRHDDSRAAEPRHGAAGQRQDRGREAEARHGADDAADDHGRGGGTDDAPGDDHGRHGGGTDDRGGDDGHRGHDG